MPKGKRILIRGQQWTLVLGRPPNNKCDGVCDYSSRTIYVRKTAPDRVGTCIHEILHACYPEVEEYAIIETEKAIMAALEAL